MRIMSKSLQRLQETFGDFDIRACSGEVESDFLGPYAQSYITIRFGHYRRIEDLQLLRDMFLCGTRVDEVCSECEDRGILYEYELRR